MTGGLSNNQLKLIAMITMTVDHIGMLLFPQVVALRVIGRLAFPIYAYMIAEGCRHTRSMPRYLGYLAGMALVCQLVYFFAMGSLYQCILVTFSLSAGLLWLLTWVRNKGGWRWLPGIAGIGLVLLLTEGLPHLLQGTDYGVDYGFCGVLLPVAIGLCRGRRMRLAAAGIVLALVSLDGWAGQWFGLLAVPLLALYNGQRGSRGMKWVFYFYYPAHLVILQGLAWLL